MKACRAFLAVKARGDRAWVLEALLKFGIHIPFGFVYQLHSSVTVIVIVILIMIATVVLILILPLILIPILVLLLILIFTIILIQTLV